MGTGYTAAFLVYQLGTLLMEGTVGTGFLPGVLIVGVLVGIVMYLCAEADKKVKKYPQKSKTRKTARMRRLFTLCPKEDFIFFNLFLCFRLPITGSCDIIISNEIQFAFYKLFTFINRRKKNHVCFHTRIVSRSKGCPECRF